MNITEKPSPNFDSREGHGIDMLVLHYTGMKTAEGAIAKLCDPDAKVSAHYVVKEDGEVLRLVPETARAWHAGLSQWRGQSNINQRSIGIEIVNPGHEYGYVPFPAAQMKMVAYLCREILSHHRNITPRNVVGHSDIAPTRKQDPGELFDWKTMAKLGIGLWPSKDFGYRAEAEKLADFGYDMTDPAKTISAFQRRFTPKTITGQWDDECAVLLAGLLKLV